MMESPSRAGGFHAPALNDGGVVGNRHAMLGIGMTAVGAACLGFGIVRLAVSIRTGAATPWWADAGACAVVAALFTWYRRDRDRRYAVALNGTALAAVASILIPIAYGLTSSVWWLSLVGFSMVLLARRGEAIAWAVGTPVLAAVAILVEPSIRIAGAAPESGLELFLEKTVFMVVLVAVAGAFRNVSEAHSRDLKDREERYHSVFSVSADSLLFFDLEDGRILDANPAACRLYGYSRDELREKTLIELSAEPAETSRAIVERTPFVALRRHRRKDGSEISVEAVARMFRQQGRKIIVVCLRDIGARLAAERELNLLTAEENGLREQLAQAQRMESIGRLAGGVAHDFNNLLTVILGNADRLRDAVPADDEFRSGLEDIVKAGNRAADLTRQLLAFSRRQMLEFRNLDLALVLGEIDRMLRRLIGERILVEVSSEPGVPPIRADRSQLEQVIVNLVLNARDAMPEGGRLSISLRAVVLVEPLITSSEVVPPGSWVVLEVRDTGHGMDAGTVARVFEPFFTTKPFGSGTGLGLATVYGIVKQTGGYIVVESRPGAGAAFRIFFSPADGAAAKDAVKVAAAALACGSETILVAEDEESVRNLLEGHLVSAGFHVLKAANGQEAIALLGRWNGRIHLLVTDVVMPGPSGPELARHLSDLNRDLKVLLISGYSPDSETTDAAARMGWRFLPKPFNRAGLLEAVRAALGA
jgi:PAS domain S-box-containing protein